MPTLSTTGSTGVDGRGRSMPPPPALAPPVAMRTASLTPSSPPTPVAGRTYPEAAATRFSHGTPAKQSGGCLLPGNDAGPAPSMGRRPVRARLARAPTSSPASRAQRLAGGIPPRSGIRARCCRRSSLRRKSSEENVPAEQPEAGQEPRFPAPHVHEGRPSDRPGPAPAGPSSPHGLSFRMAATTWRVRDRASFRALAATDRRGRSGPVRVSFVPAPSDGPPRVAFAITRRAGGAVVRNRIRRRLRAALGDLGIDVPRGTYLVTAGPAASHLPYRMLANHLARAIVTAADQSKTGASCP